MITYDKRCHARTGDGDRRNHRGSHGSPYFSRPFLVRCSFSISMQNLALVIRRSFSCKPQAFNYIFHQMPPSRGEKPGFQRSTQGHCSDSTKGASKCFAESAPLLTGYAGPSSAYERIRRRSTASLDPAFHSPINTRPRNQEHPQPLFHSSDESYFFDIIMEKVKATRVAHFVDKLAVESEPGLTNAQLMLHNHDLKPGMKAVLGIFRTLY